MNNEIRKKLPSNTIITYEIGDFIRDNIKGKTTQEMSDMIKKKFHKEVKPKTIERYKTRHNIVSGVDTTFKKNHKINKESPIGTIHIENGKMGIRHWVKVAQPNTWELRSRYLWKKYHKQEIPKDYQVTFLDGNPNNFKKSNLYLVNKSVRVTTASTRGLLGKSSKLNKLAYMAVELQKANEN